MKLTSSCYQIIQILKPIRHVLKKWDNIFIFYVQRIYETRSYQTENHCWEQQNEVSHIRHAKRLETKGTNRNTKTKTKMKLQKNIYFKFWFQKVGHKIPDWIKCGNINKQIWSLFPGQRKYWKKERAGKERVRKESSSRSKERQKSGGQGRRLYVLYSERTNCKI